VVTLDDVLAARRRIEGVIYQTPCAYTESLSRLCGARVWLKLENLQMTGSFKERGALNRLLTLTDAERARGVVTASAGNHGQALAYHAGRLGIHARIVMPEGSPLIKVDATRGHGAEVVLAGSNYDEAAAHARTLQADSGAVYVPPFDDEGVIAGQGTIGLELLDEVPELEAIVCAVGGGGLAGGIGAAVKARRPEVRLFGVQTKAVPSAAAALMAGGPVTVPAARTLADGIAVRTTGGHTAPLLHRHLDGLVTVDDEEIANAILLLLEREKTVAEGAGAAPLAALLHGHLRALAGRAVALVVSGGNIDVTLMSRIIERGLVKSGRLMRLRVRLPDQVGALAELAALIGRLRANILHVLHQRSFGGLRLGQAEVELDLETRGPAHIAELEAALRERGYEVDADR
jgi:threonine dehydratase